MNRCEKVLKLIVEYFVKNAEPVGSNTLINEYGLAYSSATIRSEINTLEQDGYLEKTYASRGRVPSSKGYRYVKQSPWNRKGCIWTHRSRDQDAQYTSNEYKAICASKGVLISMSRKGTPIDDSPTESWHGILKKETLYNNNIASLEHYVQLVEEWIAFYNSTRLKNRNL